MKSMLRSNNRGQFTIIAALLVAVILVVAVMSTYAAIRYNSAGAQPQVLTAVEETNAELKQLLGFTVGYYGSITNVTGNAQFAYNNASNYLKSGLEYIANVQPDLGTSFTLNNLDLHVNWYMGSSYSYGSLNVTYDLTGLGLHGLTYAPQCRLDVQVLPSTTIGQARLSIIQDGSNPLTGLTSQNINFYRYDYSSMTWAPVIPSIQTSFINGTYVINVPSGINPSSFQVIVTDNRGISVLASSFSQINFDVSLSGVALKNALTQNPVTIEALQTGEMRWLGQNLAVPSQSIPIPRLPIKNIRVNQTFVNGTNKEVPFQIEDWASNYSVPLGLTSQYTIFDNNQMIVYQTSSAVNKTMIWWNGSDIATETPFAYTPGPFNDNIGSNMLNNGKMSIQFNGGFNVASTIGSVTSTASFMRINGHTSDYGAGLAYVIYNAPVRDIVQQEAEWGSSVLASSCPNIYANMVLTLPSNTSYYTYQLKIMFINSAQQRTITDLSPIQLSTSQSSFQIQTENGTSGGVPFVVNGTGTFTNYGTGSTWTEHHWSQFVDSTNSGAGIMFTDASNKLLYAFDPPTAAAKTGALNVSTTQKVIEFDPVTSLGQVGPGFTTPNKYDIAWYGAVATFNGGAAQIYSNSTGTPAGLWPIVEQLPTTTVTTNAATSAVISLSPSAGSIGSTITIAGSGFAANSQISIMYDGVVVATASSDSSGNIPSGVTFNVPSSTIGTHTVSTIDANSDSATTILTVTVPPINRISQPITVGMTTTAPAATVTVTGGNPSPSTFQSDGTSHVIIIDQGAAFTLSFSNVGNTQNGFKVSNSFSAISTTYIASTTAISVGAYTQVQNTFSVSFNAGNPQPSDTLSLTGTQLGNPGTVLSLNVGGQSSVSSSAWTDYNTIVTFSASTALSGSTEKWGINAAYSTSALTTGGTTFSQTYSHQYQVTFVVTPVSAGSTAPSIATWYTAGVAGQSISASANSGYTFSSWSVAPSGSVTFANSASASTTMTVNAASTVTASFNAVASKLVFSAGGAQALTVNVVSPVAIVIQRQDASSAPVSTGASAITVALSSNGAGTFYSDAAGTTVITSVGIAAGSSNSANFYYKATAVGTGTHTLTGAYSGLTSATSPFTVSAVASKLVFTAGAGQTLTAGVVSPTAIVIQRQDAFNNPVSTGAAQITVTLSTGSAGGGFYSNAAGTTLLVGSQITIAAGQSSSVGFYYKDTVAGTPTLTGASAGLTSATSVFTVNAAAASKLVFIAAPATVVHNQFTTVFTVQRQDQYGNPSTSGGSIVIALADGAANGHFYLSQVQNNEISSVTIGSSSSSANFYWIFTSNSNLNQKTITASSNGLTSATTKINVT